MARTRSGTSPRLSTYRPVLDRLIFGLALLGVLASVHLNIQQSRGFDQGCFGFTAAEPVEQTFNCEAVTQSDASTLLGISNSIWGLLFYVFVAGLTAAAAFNVRGRRPQFKITRGVIIAVGMAYSLYLVYYQFFAIGELCALCLTSAGITTALFLVQAVDYARPPQAATTESQGMTPKPSRELAFVGALVVLVGLLIGADLAYFNNLDKAEPIAVTSDQAAQTVSERSAVDPNAGLPAECRYDTDRGRIENPARLVNFYDPSKGNPNAPVTVIEYFDPNCPHCATLQPIMESVIATHQNQARFVFKPFVLWPHSFAQSEALYAAAQQGKFFEMLDRQYAIQNPQTGLSEQQLRMIAADIGMDPDQLIERIQSGDYRQTLLQLKQAAVEVGVNSTPTVIINGRFVEPASRTPECLRRMIDQAAQS